MNKLVAEAFGTAVLVLVGCGSVALTGNGGAMPLGILPIALAFGLSVTAMAYGIGPISGCHINPAVTAAVWSAGRMETTRSGEVHHRPVHRRASSAPASSGVILMGNAKGYNLATSGLGQTTFANYSVGAAFLTEAVATLIFTVVILGVTQKNGGGNVAGLVIGLTLALLHLAFVPVTGNSLNPARTFAPNLYVGGQAAAQIWLYMVAPMVGGVLAGMLFKSGLFNADK
jgi:aquaporin Z